MARKLIFLNYIIFFKLQIAIFISDNPNNSNRECKLKAAGFVKDPILLISILRLFGVCLMGTKKERNRIILLHKPFPRIDFCMRRQSSFGVTERK